VQTAPEVLAAVEEILNAAGRSVPGRDGSSVRVTHAACDAGQFQVKVELTLPPRDVIVGGMPARVVLVNRGGWFGRSVPSAPTLGADGLLVLDAQGRKLPMEISEGRLANGNGMAWEYTLTGSTEQGGPVRLVYSGRRSLSVEVPFTLKGLPLPSGD
jgi:hypothetical protein